jgi:hypothetical protein
MNTSPLTVAVGGLALTLLSYVATPVLAQQQESQEELAKKLSNPISSLITVPFQNNFWFRGGPHQSGFTYIDNIQPVVPINLDDEWNLIVRTILPNIFKENVPQGREFGLGDTTQSFFLSPSKPTAGGIIWDVGPVFLWPTGTSPALGSQKWGAGPTFVALRQDARGPSVFSQTKSGPMPVLTDAPTSTRRAHSRSSRMRLGRAGPSRRIRRRPKIGRTTS